MGIIKNTWAREILDSRGIPTIEIIMEADTGAIAVASVPSGTSTGTHEAIELRDGDEKRFRGLGVIKAIENINKIISPAVAGKDPANQSEIDNILKTLDGTDNKSKLGANATLAVSTASVKLAALLSATPVYKWVNFLYKKYDDLKIKIPSPMFNMINGGLHGAGNLDFQEFHVTPTSTKTYSEGLKICVEIYMYLKSLLEEKGAVHSVGDEGGYAPNLFTNADALEIISESVKQAGFQLGRDVLLSLDVAANVIYKNNAYVIKDVTSPLDEASFIEYLKQLNSRYHLNSIEDPIVEDSWDGWKKITDILGKDLTIIGDDFLVTNPKRVKKAIEMGSCNGILVKPNQIGTISETFEVISMARKAKWKVTVSHRSGETNDWFIADFAVGVASDFVKFGGPARGERVAKYNRLLGIDKELQWSA